MRIRSVLLNNFRPFRQAAVNDLGAFNFISGANGSGKSTILDAMAVALTGTYRGAETGRGLEELRQSGARNRWEVGLTAEDAQAFPAIVRKEGDGPRSSMQGMIDATLGIPSTRVRACLYSGELMRLDRKEAQRLILDLVESEVAVPDEVSELIREHLHPQWADGPITLPQLDVFYKRAYEMRREAGIEARASTSTQPEPPEGFEMLRDMDSSRLAEEKAKLEAVIRDLLKERDGMLGEEAARKKGIEAEQRAVLSLRRQIAKAQEEHEKLVQVPTDPEQDVNALRARAHQIDKDRATATEERRKLTAAQSEARTALASLEEQMAALRGIGERCPTCQQRTKPETIKHLMDALEDSRQTRVKALAGIETQLQSLRTNFEDSTALRIQADRLDQADKRRGELAKRISELDGEFEEAKRSLLQAEQKGSVQVDDSVLVARTREGQRRLNAITEYAGALKNYERSADIAETARTRHASLETLVEALGPNGIRRQAAGGLDEFQCSLNKSLAGLGGFTVDLRPLVELRNDATVNGRPSRLLSSSEQIRFGIAFQVAIARISGLGIVAVDDWDRFDSVSASGAQKVLAGCGHQVFVFSTLRQDLESYERKAQAVRGVNFYLVERQGTESRIRALSGVTA